MHIPATAREDLKLPPYTAISTLQEALLQSFPHNPVFATTLLEELNRVFYAATK